MIPMSDKTIIRNTNTNTIIVQIPKYLLYWYTTLFIDDVECNFGMILSQHPRKDLCVQETITHNAYSEVPQHENHANKTSHRHLALEYFALALYASVQRMKQNTACTQNPTKQNHQTAAPTINIDNVICYYQVQTVSSVHGFIMFLIVHHSQSNQYE